MTLAEAKVQAAQEHFTIMQSDRKKARQQAKEGQVDEDSVLERIEEAVQQATDGMSERMNEVIVRYNGCDNWRDYVVTMLRDECRGLPRKESFVDMVCRGAEVRFERDRM